LAEFNQIRPMFASLLPVSDYHKDVNPQFQETKIRPPATILELNSWLRNYCEQHHFTYVDYYSAMVDKSGFLPAELSDDGLHPNAQGYRVMAPVALQAIDNTLKGMAPAKKKGGIFHRKEHS
jgi:lysophospholipase L1-like esterase